MKMVCTADIHIGHSKLLPYELYEKFRTYVYKELQDADLFIIAGDFFDNLINMNSDASFVAMQIISDIYHLSKRHGFIVRVLRGTYSHDREQSQLFLSCKSDSGFKDIDIKYIDTISIEYINKLNMKILYVPDDLPYDNSTQTVTVIKEILDSAGWNNVDLMIGHGYFRHVLPPELPEHSSHAPKIVFNHEQFEDIINGLIVMGHVHTPSANKNVIYTGSFDRLAHGEEHPKGFVTCTLNKETNKWSSKFIENEIASKFITIRPKGKDFNECISNFLNVLEKIDKTRKVSIEDKVFETLVYIRVIHEDPELRQVLKKICLDKYPYVIYTHTSNSKQTINLKNKLSTIDIQTFDEDIVLNDDNLPEMICLFLDNTNIQHGLTPLDVASKINTL